MHDIWDLNPLTWHEPTAGINAVLRIDNTAQRRICSALLNWTYLNDYSKYLYALYTV